MTNDACNACNESAEAKVSISAACRDPRLMKNGRPIAPQNVYRWIKAGRKTPCGHVFLEAVVSIHGYATTREAIGRFVAAIERPVVAAAGVPAVGAGHRQASAALDAMGYGSHQ